MTGLVQKYKLGNSTWTYKGFHGVLHTFFPVGEAPFHMKKNINYNANITLFFVENNYVHWYWNDDHLTETRRVFFKRLKADRSYLKKLLSVWKQKCLKLDKAIAVVHQTDLAKLTDSALVKLYGELYRRYEDEFACSISTGDAVSMHADRYLVPEFEKVLGDDFTSIFPLLVTTHHKSFIEQEQEDRAKLAGIMKRTGKLSSKILEKHAKKYFYINNNYAKAVYLTGPDFKKMIGGRDMLSKKTSPNFKKRKSLIKKYKLNSWQKTLLLVMDEFFGVQDTRKKYVLICNYYQFRFLAEVEKRTNIPFPLLQYSVFPELSAILKGKISRETLSRRKKLCVCVRTAQGYGIETGKKAQSILKFMAKLQKTGSDTRGMVASGGKARGRVKIILKIHDLINMEKGDILVTSMTRPEMIQAMKLASGIVTDEGGITSHAAIVSRELGIPCIIGTKIATKVFKDGDMVEVDANKGVVRKV